MSHGPTQPPPRNAQLLKLSQWVRRLPFDVEIAGLRTWLLAHPESPGLPVRKWRQIEMQHAPLVCHVCGVPALYVAARWLDGRLQREGYCRTHRTGHANAFRIAHRNAQAAARDEAYNDMDRERRSAWKHKHGSANPGMTTKRLAGRP